MPAATSARFDLEEIHLHPHRKCSQHKYEPTTVHFSGAIGRVVVAAESCACGMLRIRKGIFSPINIVVETPPKVVSIRERAIA